MALNIFSIIVYVIFALICFMGISFSNSTSSDDFFTRLNSFRGIMALEIVLGHCVRYEHSLLSPFGNFMLIGVGYFFFVSGFGLSKSYHTKSDYLKTFIQSKILRLIVIAMTALAVISLVSVVYPVKTDLSYWELSIPYILKNLIVRTNWYIRELIALYILFYITYRFVQKRRALCIASGTLLLCIILFMLGYTRCWYASIFCFPLGIIFYENYDWICSSLLTVKGHILSLVVFLVGISELLWKTRIPQHAEISFQSAEGISAISNNILCIGFIMILFIICQKVVIGNKVNRLLTRFSTEIYLSQFVCIAIAEKSAMPVMLKIPFILVADALIAAVIHLMLRLIMNGNNR